MFSFIRHKQSNTYFMYFDLKKKKLNRVSFPLTNQNIVYYIYMVNKFILTILCLIKSNCFVVAFFFLKMHFNVHSKRSFYNLGFLRIRFLSIKWITQINRFIICLESIDKEKFQPQYIRIFKLYSKCEAKYCQCLLSKLSHTHWVEN